MHPPSPAAIILLDGHNYCHHYVELIIYNIFTSYNSLLATLANFELHFQGYIFYHKINAQKLMLGGCLPAVA